MAKVCITNICEGVTIRKIMNVGLFSPGQGPGPKMCGSEIASNILNDLIDSIAFNDDSSPY